MNKLIRYRKTIIIFTITLSILFGVLIYNKLSKNSINLIITSSNKLKYMNTKVLLFHFLLLLISFVLSFIGIGSIILTTYLFFEGVTIGFMLSYFLSVYKFKGIVYGISYLLIYKLVLMFLLLVLFFKFLNIFRSTIKYIKKDKIEISKTIINSVIIIFIIILNDFILILFGKNLLNLFTFYLK